MVDSAVSTRDAARGDGLSLLLISLSSRGDRAALRGHSVLLGRRCVEDEDIWRIGVGTNPWVPVSSRTQAAAMVERVHWCFIFRRYYVVGLCIDLLGLK